MSRRFIVVALAAVVIVGFAVRLWYGHAGLHAGRFYDERFSFDNVAAFSDHGIRAPPHGYYQLSSYLPQALLIAAADSLEPESALPPSGKSRFSSSDYQLARGLQAVYGALTLWLTFLVGRQLFGPWVGLGGAFVLAFTPFHIHASAIFKPDVLLACTCMLALLLALRLLERERRIDWALAGGGVGLAMSSKLLGGLAALPLVVLVLASLRRSTGRVVGLVIAGFSALVSFLILNPDWRLNLFYLEVLDREYEMKALEDGSAGRSTTALLLEFLFSEAVFGIWIGALALAGLLILGWQVLRRPDPASTSWLAKAMFLSFPVFYLASYLLVTDHFKGNNFLPLLPIAALLASWTVAHGYAFFAGRLPTFDGAVGRLAVGLVLCMPIGIAGFSYAYAAVTPSSEDLALGRLAQAKGKPDGRTYLLLDSPEMPIPWELRRPFPCAACALVWAQSLEDWPASRLETVDALVASERAIEDSPALRKLIELPGWRSQEIDSAGFSVRGPPLRLLLRHWRPTGDPLALNFEPLDRSAFQAVLPEAFEAKFVSLIVHTPRIAMPPLLAIGGVTRELFPAARNARVGSLLISERVRMKPGDRVVLTFEGTGRTPSASVIGWRRPRKSRS